MKSCRKASLFLVFFALGLYKIPVLVMSLPFIIFLAGKEIRIKKSFFFSYFPMAFFLILALFFFQSNLVFDNAAYSIISYLLIMLLYGFIFSNLSRQEQVSAFTFFMLAMFLDAVLVVGYNYIYGGGSYGYGLLLNPFTNREVNSPAWALMLAAGSYVFVQWGMYKGLLIKSLMWVVFFFVIVLGVFLSSRAFIVLQVFTLIMLVYFDKRGSSILYLLLGVGLVAGLIILWWESLLEYTARYAKGLESGRWSLLEEGLSKLAINPLGGFKPNYVYHETVYYHNFWIDAARIGGVIPFLFFVALSLYCVSKAYRLRSLEGAPIVVGAHFLLLLIMFQDVILEGNWRIMVAYYFTCIFIIGCSQGESRKQQIIIER